MRSPTKVALEPSVALALATYAVSPASTRTAPETLTAAVEPTLASTVEPVPSAASGSDPPPPTIETENMFARAQARF